MQYRNKKTRIIINYSLSIIFLFLGIISSNAQPDYCQGVLENLNTKKPFPQEKEADYFRCLASIETEYGKSVQKNKDTNKEIEKTNSELRKRNAELERAKQNNDTININKLDSAIRQIEKVLNTSKEKLAADSLQSTTYKNLLAASYARMKDYYENEKEDSVKAKIYEDKLNSLNRSN
jgi:hypothetical protein